MQQKSKLQKPMWYIIPMGLHLNTYGPFKTKKEATSYKAMWVTHPERYRIAKLVECVPLR